MGRLSILPSTAEALQMGLYQFIIIITYTNTTTNANEQFGRSIEKTQVIQI